jgi:hypothetical protein
MIINSFNSVNIDGVDVGDCFSAIANYPDQAGAILAALASYEQGLIAAAVQAPEIQAIDPSQVAELNATIGQLQQTIEQLKLEVSPDIAAITPALMAAGLLAWGNRATAGEDEETLALVIQLRDAAMAPRSITQCDRIKHLFGEICQRSGVVPSPSEAQAMQAILDIGPASTGPIAAKYLSFAPWMQPGN